MAVRVSPTESTPSHHLSLSDGSHTLGLILANGKGEKDVRGIKQNGYPRSVTRISQNVAGYSDFELPYSPQVQENWSGGRGNEDFDRDTTRFYDSYRADTTRGDIVCGPKETLHSIQNTLQSSSAPTGAFPLTTASYCVRFTASFSGTLRAIDLLVDRYTASGQAATVTGFVRADATGLPGSLLTGILSGFVSGDPVNQIGIPVRLIISSGVAVTAGSSYWLDFSTTDPDVYLQGNVSAPGKNIYVYGDPSTVVFPDAEFYYSLSTFSLGSLRLFEYRGSLMAVQQPEDGSAPRLFLNGYHGMSADNPATKGQLKTTLDLTGVDLTGAIARIVAGPGSTERHRWRQVTSNTSSALNVSPAWKTAHTTATEYAILGVNTWSEITGHGLTQEVTAVLVVDDVLYFAQGEATTIRRGRYSAGSWTWAFDGTDANTGNQATFLALIPDSEGKKKIWLAKSTASSVSCSDAKPWGTNLAPMATWLTCGSTDSKITGMEGYAADGALIPYIFKEDGFGSIGGTTTDKVGVYAEHPLSAQIKQVRSETNGWAHMRYDLFLKFSLLDGLESHFDQRLDDVGPNRDEGLPAGRRGPIVYLTPYAGRFYAAVDAGPSGYSSILCCTSDNSWHEIYRSSFLGFRIQSLCVQTIPGETADRLWFNENENIYWLPLAINPRKQADYTYTSLAQVTTASIYCGFKDVTKYFDSLTLFSEGLNLNGQKVLVEYQTDSEIGTPFWHPLYAPGTVFIQSPVQTIKLSAANNVAGKGIRLRLTLSTTNPTKTPRIKAIRLDSVIRLKPKHMWTVTYLVKDNMLDLSGMPVAPITAGQPLPEDTQAWLDAFADSDTTACPLTLHHLRGMFDNKTVFVEPNSISPLTQVVTPNGETVQIGSFNLLEA